MAITGTGPIDDGGTVKLAKNTPLLVVFTVAGVVVTTVEPLNVISTVELGSNPDTCNIYRSANRPRRWIKENDRVHQGSNFKRF